MMMLSRRCRAVLFAIALPGALLCTPASAQEFTQTFINPSFGGNPFYSDHLLGIANIDRPEEPQEEDDAPTSDELLVSQLRGTLATTTITDLSRQIQTVPEGQSRTVVIGDQRITFVRTGNVTRVTFFNGRTGETTELDVPVLPTTNPSLGSPAQTASAEQLLRTQSLAPLTSFNRTASTGSVTLFSAPLGSAATSASVREGQLLAPPPIQ